MIVDAFHTAVRGVAAGLAFAAYGAFAVLGALMALALVAAAIIIVGAAVATVTVGMVQAYDGHWLAWTLAVLFGLAALAPFFYWAGIART